MSVIKEIKESIINKNYNKGIKLLENILSLKPNDIEANFLLAIIYEEKKEYKLSIDQYKFTNKIKEGNLIYNRIATLYTKLGKYSFAIENYERSLNINSNVAETHNNYGLLLVLKNNEKKALHHFEKAIKLKKNYLDPIYNYLEISEKTNKLNNLSEYINKLTDDYPNDNIFKLFKALDLENNKNFLDAKKILENILFTKLQFKWEVRRLNVLGFIYQNLKDYNNSFLYFKKCNKFLIQNFCKKLFDKNIYLKKLSRHIIDSKNYAETKNKIINNSNNNLNIFLVGFPRSGTTLLDNILNSHQNIQVIEEQPMLYESLKNLSEDEQINIKDQNIKKSREIYFNELKKRLGNTSNNNKKIIIDKMPLNFIYARNIYKIFPNAKIIFCLRHPLDCILSCYIQNFKINEAMINCLDLKKTASLYDKSFTLFNSYSEIPKKFIYYTKYENLVDNVKSETSKILKFLHVESDEKIFDFYLNSKNKERIRTASYKQVIKPIYLESKYKWQKYEKNLNEIIPLAKKWIDFYRY